MKLNLILEASPIPFGFPHHSANTTFSPYTANRGYFAGTSLSKNFRPMSSPQVIMEPPNSVMSFEGKFLQKLSMEKDGIEKNDKWNYEKINKIENLIQAGYVTYDGEKYRITKAGKKQYKNMNIEVYKDKTMPTYTNVFSMRSQMRF